MKLYGAVDEEQKAALKVGTRVRVGKRVVVALGLGFVKSLRAGTIPLWDFRSSILRRTAHAPGTAPYGQ